MAVAILVALATVALILISGLKILREYERAVVFRLGRLTPYRGPGVTFIFPIIERMVRIDLRTVTLEIPAQDVITHDNVSVKVSAVVYFRVVDPSRAVVEIQNYLFATLQLAQTTLRSVGGQTELDELLAQREKLNARIQEIVDAQTEPWGIKVVLVELKNIDLPQDMQRAIAAQAEADARAARQGDRGGGRIPGRAETGRRSRYNGTQPDLRAASLPANAQGNSRRAQLYHPVPDPNRYTGNLHGPTPPPRAAARSGRTAPKDPEVAGSRHVHPVEPSHGEVCACNISVPKRRQTRLLVG